MTRYVTIWFPYFKTDWMILRRKELSGKPFVLTINDHGRKLITASSPEAVRQGVHTGMVAADARALLRNLEIMDDDSDGANKVLKRLAHWSIRYTPAVMLDEAGLILNATKLLERAGLIADPLSLIPKLDR